VDVIGTAPAGPDSWRHRARRAASSVRRRFRDRRRDGRGAAGGLVLVLVLGAVVLLRVGLPAPVTPWTSQLRPPYDHLPGRQPIPAPTPVRDDPGVVEGTLPIGPQDGGGGRAPEERAVRMVLGRYCTDPDGLTVTFVGVAAVGVATSPWDGHAVVAVVLYQDGNGGDYQWRGWVDQLRRCP